MTIYTSTIIEQCQKTEDFSSLFNKRLTAQKCAVNAFSSAICSCLGKKGLTAIPTYSNCVKTVVNENNPNINYVYPVYGSCVSIEEESSPFKSIWILYKSCFVYDISNEEVGKPENYHGEDFIVFVSKEYIEPIDVSEWWNVSSCIIKGLIPAQSSIGKLLIPTDDWSKLWSSDDENITQGLSVCAIFNDDNNILYIIPRFEADQNFLFAGQQTVFAIGDLLRNNTLVCSSIGNTFLGDSYHPDVINPYEFDNYNLPAGFVYGLDINKTSLPGFYCGYNSNKKDGKIYQAGLFPVSFVNTPRFPYNQNSLARTGYNTNSQIFVSGCVLLGCIKTDDITSNTEFLGFVSPKVLGFTSKYTTLGNNPAQSCYIKSKQEDHSIFTNIIISGEKSFLKISNGVIIPWEVNSRLDMQNPFPDN